MVCTSRAQSLRYGYFSLDSVFTAMPEYAVAQKNLADLRAKYDEEMKRAEDEFNAKYEEFLETQRDLIPFHSVQASDGASGDNGKERRFQERGCPAARRGTQGRLRTPA